jgi:hypothetical protein
MASRGRPAVRRIGGMGNVALRTAGLTERYGRVVALDGLDLEVGTGEAARRDLGDLRPGRPGPRPAGGPLLPARGNPVATRYPPLSPASPGSKPTAAGNFDTHICSWATLASLALVVLNRRPAVMSMAG